MEMIHVEPGPPDPGFAAGTYVEQLRSLYAGGDYPPRLWAEVVRQGRSTWTEGRPLEYMGEVLWAAFDEVAEEATLDEPRVMPMLALSVAELLTSIALDPRLPQHLKSHAKATLRAMVRAAGG